MMRDLKSDLETAADYQNDTEKALNSLWWDNLTYTVKEAVVTVGTAVVAGAAAGAAAGLGNYTFYYQPVWKDQPQLLLCNDGDKNKNQVLFIGKSYHPVSRERQHKKHTNGRQNNLNSKAT